ncbi:uncharacterized protein LOC129884299 [Solanum dulcamara]|uniref:uncharacterized protein LOC129884299 n=1 Tax=Solanum dulcamara TaxID=45834 RepID=UPI002486CDF6|nr:uncharacterized protein LOC129884299 [Solanum dulcamara]
MIQQCLVTTQSMKKSYVDRRVREVSFPIGERVLLKVSPTKDVMRFGMKRKHISRFIVIFEVLEKYGEVDYKLTLSINLLVVPLVFHVSMLKRYHHDDSHVIQWDSISFDQDLSFEEEPIAILDR